MKIVSHKCPGCGANLKLKPGVTEGTCEYCQASFSIDDGITRIENKTTVEIKDDNDLEIAIATLDNFKEYGKSEFLFKNLLYRYGHQKEIYIYLIRSITHDFNLDIERESRLNEINEYWEKYKSLAKPKDISKYEEKVINVNKNYWHTLLKESSSNFNAKKSEESSKKIELYWNNYNKYCTKEEANVLKIKYNDFLKKKKQYEKESRKKKQIVLLGVIALIILIFLIDFFVLYTDKLKQVEKDVKVSELILNCANNTCDDVEFLYAKFKTNQSTLKIKSALIDKERNKVVVDTELKNRYKTTNKKYELDIIDDYGPVIESKSCYFTDTEEVDINKCFSVYDYTDKDISEDKIEVVYNEDDFKIEGIKKVTVTAFDNDNNKTTKEIDVNITKSDLVINMKLSKNLNVGETTKLVYTFTPNNISNKEVELIYDEEYLSIDKNNNVTAKKKGKTNICLISKYNDTKTCIDVNVGLTCPNTVRLKFDGGNKETIIADEHFCTGKYKMYASVQNRDKTYYIYVIPKGEFSGDSMRVNKETSFFNEEGKKFTLNAGTKIEVPLGVTEIKLVKTS